MKKNLLYIISISTFFFILALQISCNSDTLKNRDIKSTIIGTLQKETQVDSFSIIISNTGGFTGLGNGYTLSSDGTVKHWKQLSFVKDTTLWERKADLNEVINFKNQLDTCGILQKQFNGTDNITTRLVYNLKDTSYTWTWKGKGASKNIPTEINNWYKKIISFLKNITE